jgi:hypothetical protein
MGWTVACYCGNVYTAPPGECNVCHSGFDYGETHGAAATVVTDADPGLQDDCIWPGLADILAHHPIVSSTTARRAKRS